MAGANERREGGVRAADEWVKSQFPYSKNERERFVRAVQTDAVVSSLTIVRDRLRALSDGLAADSDMDGAAAVKGAEIIISMWIDRGGSVEPFES